MKRVKLTLSFDGTPFAGFQVQKNAPTIQGALCAALKTLYRAEVPVCGCSRTDAGVHARRFVCHADLPDGADADVLLRGANALLPREISVLAYAPASDRFHARYSALHKTYRYYVWLHASRAPLYENRVLHYPYPVDCTVWDRAAKALCGTHDFKSFLAAGGKTPDSTVRTVSACKWVRDDHLAYLEITADGFLYHMVRILAGTMLDMAAGKIGASMEEILESRDRNRAGKTAPPQGLYLWDVCYPQEI